MNAEITAKQKAICKKHEAQFLPCAATDKVGIALSTLAIQPTYGVRVRNADGTATWYLWGGPYSDDPGFYQPLCAEHLCDHAPFALKYLGLPVGYRFIIDQNGYEDVWFEEHIPT